MGDSSFRRQREHFRPERILDRFEPTRLVVEIARIVLHEGHEPNPLADLRDADGLPRQPILLERALKDGEGKLLLGRRQGLAGDSKWQRRIEDILDAIAEIQSFSAGMTVAQF